MSSVSRFNLRVYGLLVNEDSELLVSKETVAGKQTLKFPGGGVQPGEGIVDGLIREFYEETGADVEVGELFYLTEHFQLSAFDSKDQLISIYYFVDLKEGLDAFNPSVIVEDEFEEFSTSIDDFLWININELDADDFLFPIDKLVVDLIKK